MGLNCQVNIINSSGVDNGAVNLPYLPYCVSTMKVLLTNHENENMDITIYPINHVKDDNYIGGYIDEGEAMKVIWGGGDEGGVKQKNLEPEQSKFVYFFLVHSEDTISNYDLTMILEKSTSDDQDPEKEHIKVKLVPIHNSSDALRSIENSNSNVIEFKGSTVLNYYPRWFPESFTKLHSTVTQERENIQTPVIEILNNHNNDRTS